MLKLSIDNCEFEVDFTEISGRYYKIKFEKKYKKHWIITEKAIIESLQRVYGLQDTDRLDPIKTNGGYGLCKLSFRVSGTNKSARDSGNRAIVFVDNTRHKVEILLIYSKNEISSPNETQKWESMVEDLFPDIWNLFKC